MPGLDAATRRDRLARALLGGEVRDGDTVVVDRDGDELTVRAA